MFEHQMTEEEVRRSYRLAKNPEEQIKILSQINAETPKKIRRVIEGQSWEEATERRKRKSRYVPKGKNKTWTVNELKELKNMHIKKVPRKEMARALNRSLNSINGALRYIKIKEAKYDLG